MEGNHALQPSIDKQSTHPPGDVVDNEMPPLPVHAASTCVVEAAASIIASSVVVEVMVVIIMFIIMVTVWEIVFLIISNFVFLFCDAGTVGVVVCRRFVFDSLSILTNVSCQSGPCEMRYRFERSDERREQLLSARR
jgi:hypothetical protein